MDQVNLLAVGAAALSTFLIGGLWYSPVLFAKPWMALNGFTEEDLKSANMLRTFGISFLCSVIIAFNLAAFLGSESDLAFDIAAGFATGFGWVAMSMGMVYTFERKPLKLWLINAGYHVVAYTVMGVIIGLIQ